MQLFNPWKRSKLSDISCDVNTIYIIILNMIKSSFKSLGVLAILVIALLGLVTAEELPSDCDSTLDVKLAVRATLKTCSG